MAKKLTFDALPAAVDRILEILTSEGSEHTALPELVQRITLLAKKIDYLQRIVSPDRPVMDMSEVCRVLRLRPKAVNELAMSGKLPFREQGKKRVFDEQGVVNYFMTLPAWKEATVSESAETRRTRRKIANEPVEAIEPTTATPVGKERERIGIAAASAILDRSLAAVYQLTAAGKVPFHKDGPKKIYFYEDELREWSVAHLPRPRKEKQFSLYL
jgi:hypothetical protein